MKQKRFSLSKSKGFTLSKSKGFTLSKSKGFSIIEIIISLGIFSIIIFPMIQLLLTSQEASRIGKNKIKSMFLSSEYFESLKNLRRDNWDYLVNGQYLLATISGTLSLVPTTTGETIDDYTRYLTISDAFRDETGKLVESGGTADPSTKKVTVTVSWEGSRPSSVVQSSYLTRYLDNLAWTQTTKTDFEQGTLNSVTITDTYGGEVILSAGGLADWCKPQESIIETLTLPKQGNTIVSQPGSSYVGTGDGSSGVTFVNIAISNPPFPATPSASIAGTYESSYKTNAIYSDGNYVYLATDGSTSQVIILDITQNPYVKIGWINVPSGVAANGIYVANNIAFVTSGRRLYTYNVTNKAGEHNTPLTSISVWLGFFSPLAKQVVVVGNYAYVGTANTLFGLQKFKVSNNGSTLKLVGVSNLSWQQAAQGLAVNPTGQRAYVAFNQGGGIFPKGFFIVDTSPADPPAWWPLPNWYNIKGTYNAGSTDPRGMTVVSGNKAIIVGLGGTQQYQVVDITNETSPVSCGGLSISTGVTGVSSIQELDGDVFSDIITGESQDQFKIIEGGPGGRQYAASGFYESPTLDTQHQSAFNRLFLNFSIPSQTNIKFQTAVKDATGGNCQNVNFTNLDFVGPDSTSFTYFTLDGVIPLNNDDLNYENPGQCFRFRAYLETADSTQTPVLNDFTVNYSP